MSPYDIRHVVLYEPGEQELTDTQLGVRMNPTHARYIMYIKHTHVPLHAFAFVFVCVCVSGAVCMCVHSCAEM
jgi:hypothetical protein